MMADLTREQLVELVAREVAGAVAKREAGAQKDEILSVCLIAGCVDKLPQSLKEKRRCVSIGKYNGDITTIDEIFITDLSLTELADIALGRNDGPVQAAVIDGLTHGKAIYMDDSALGYRQAKEKCNPNFYRMLEQYAACLQSFGIRPIRDASNGGNPQKPAGGLSEGLPGGVVTELSAKALVKECSGEVLLSKGTIITPSAKDVFLHAGCRIRYV
jgi:hypothetical protein